LYLKCLSQEDEERGDADIRCTTWDTETIREAILEQVVVPETLERMKDKREG
jgi:hypothetical protein